METHKNFTDNPSSKASSSGRNNRPWDRPWDRRDKEELRTLSDQSANLVTSEADTGSLAEFLERQAKRRTHDELSSSGSEIGDLSIKKIKTGEDEKTAKEQLSSIERDITKINAHDNINLIKRDIEKYKENVNLYKGVAGGLREYTQKKIGKISSTISDIEGVQHIKKEINTLKMEKSSTENYVLNIKEDTSGRVKPDTDIFTTKIELLNRRINDFNKEQKNLQANIEKNLNLLEMQPADREQITNGRTEILEKRIFEEKMYKSELENKMTDYTGIYEKLEKLVPEEKGKDIASSSMEASSQHSFDQSWDSEAEMSSSHESESVHRSQTEQVEPPASRPARSAEQFQDRELRDDFQGVADAYARTKTANDLPPKLREQINAHPFTDTEVTMITTLLQKKGLPSKEYQKARRRIYDASATIREQKRAHRQTDTGKAVQRAAESRYRKTEGGKTMLAKKYEKHIQKVTDANVSAIPGAQIHKDYFADPSHGDEE